MNTSHQSYLRLTREQFRRFAAIAKQHGCVLDIEPASKFRKLGDASGHMSAAIDARNPHSKFMDFGQITLAESWSATAMANAWRPEMDWGAIPAELMQEFILWHEVGHKVWNFSTFELEFDGNPKLWEINKGLRIKTIRCNEVLADRFAWKMLFPGKPLPLRISLFRSERRTVNKDIEDLAKGSELKLKDPEPLSEGQYHFVSWKMLNEPRLAAFVGPECLLMRPHFWRVKDRYPQATISYMCNREEYRLALESDDMYEKRIDRVALPQTAITHSDTQKVAA